MVLFSFFVVLEINPRASCMLGKYSNLSYIISPFNLGTASHEVAQNGFKLVILSVSVFGVVGVTMVYYHVWHKK